MIEYRVGERGEVIRLVTSLLAAAALERGVDPDRLSFKNALVIVRRYLPPLAQATAAQASPLLPG